MSKKQLIILTHGKFGEELIGSAEMIIGSLEQAKAFSLMPNMSADEYKEEVREYLSKIEGDVICLVDLFGGTPSNTIMYLSQDFPLSIVSGVNLPMLLEVYMNLENSSSENLADLAVNTLKESGKNISQMLKANKE